jgi:hypothetical protein
MIDYFALALGHGLLVLAFLRLVMRDSLDVDPAITELKEGAEAKRTNPRANRRSPRARPQADESKPEL